MKTYNLPDDLYGGGKLSKEDIIIYHYTSKKDSLKEKSILNRNAFSLVITGNKTMHFAEKTVNVQDSEIHILSAGNCIASVTMSGQKVFESILIFFDNNVLFDFYSAHAELIDKLKAKSKKSNSYISFKKDDFISHFIQSLLLILRKNIRLSESMRRVKLQELLLYLLENHSERFLSFKPALKLTDVELRIRKVVEINEENNLSLEELSFLCNVSVSTFKRQFKKIFNSAPSKWLHEKKMTAAGRMLVERNKKPSEIWHKLGFETHAGFTKSFKKHFGCSPKDYSK